MTSRVLELEGEIAALRRVVDVLARRVEQQASHGPAEDRMAMIKALSSLENTVDVRSRELALSEARYRALYDHSPDMLLSIAGDGRISTCNATAARALTQDPAGLAGVLLEDLFAPDVRKTVARWRKQGYADETSPELPLASQRWVSLNAAPIPGPAAVSLVVMRDVTARRTLEVELQHANRLAGIGHLAAGVAHEINNPLAVLLLRLELLERQLALPSFDPRAAAEQAAVLRAHVLRIARIVRNLQTFARPNTEERQSCRIGDLYAAVVELTRDARGAARMRLVERPPGLTVDVDRGAIEQVLVNLVANAAQAMKLAGIVTIRVGPGALGRVVIQVDDEGPGIPPGLIEMMFTPFVTDRQDAGGMGLGLAIAWRIVDEHGGVLRGANRPDGGARFDLDLPASGRSASPPEDEPSIPPLRPLRLLVVDDEPLLAGMIRQFAEALGHTVGSVASAEQALEALEEHLFDAMITDIRLPGISGEALATRVAERWPALGRRIIFISGAFHPPRSGQRYLQKPFGQRELLALLVEVAG